MTAIKREILEEIEYKLANPRLLLVMDAETADYKGTWYIFIAQYDNYQKIILHEGERYEWMTLHEASQCKMNIPNTKTLDLIQKLIQHNCIEEFNH